MVKLDELKIFIAIVETGSFNQAASQLNIAASVVSRSIKRLESGLRTTLFNRTTRKISLTEEGRWLLAKARTITDTLEDVNIHFKDNKNAPEGELRVDAATPFALHTIAPFLAEFTSRYPKINVTLESNESIINLIERKVDVAIRVGPLENSSLKARKIGNTSRALYASPGYLSQYGIPKTVDDLSLHQCLGFTQPDQLNVWPLINKQGEWVAITPYMRSNSGETLKQLALHHNGIICVSKFSVANEVKSGELVPVLSKYIQYQPIPISAVYYSERSVSQRVRCFIDFLCENVNFE